MICSLSTTPDIDHYHDLQGLVLADESLIDGSPLNIDILIGSDYYFDIILGEIRQGGEGPITVNSEFGWLVSGNVEAGNSGIEEADINLIIERSDASYHNPGFRAHSKSSNFVVTDAASSRIEKGGATNCIIAARFVLCGWCLT